MNPIIIKNLNFSYNNKKVLNDVNLEIEENKITTILGNNGSGKSTLIKILIGLLSAQGTVVILEKNLNKKNIKQIRKAIGVVLENPDNQFITESVIDEIAFTLENMNYKKKETKTKIDEISNKLGITHLLECGPQTLNKGQKQLVSLASALVHDPKILILDEAFTYIDKNEMEKVLKLLLELKNNGLTIINVTHDIEQTLISDNIILMDKGNITFEGTKDELYKLETTKINFELPFIIELSNRLIFYDLIDKLYYNMDELVEALWK